MEGEFQLSSPTQVRDGVSSLAIPRLSIRVIVFLLALAVGMKLLDRGIIELNARKVILPKYDLTLIPYHDADFTRTDARLTNYKTPPSIILTGDSRVRGGFDPSVTARKLNINPEVMFNFGINSQTIAFARSALIPHLIKKGRKPKYLAFTITPEFLLKDYFPRGLTERYTNSLAFRVGDTNIEDGDTIDNRISSFLARNFALFRYRSDLIEQEIVPSVKCWINSDCVVRVRGYGELSYRELASREGVASSYGWSPQAWDGLTDGTFKGRARYDENDEIDYEGMKALLTETRVAGMTPILVVMPLHTSFLEVHKAATERILVAVESIAKDEGIVLIYPKGDYSDPKLFTDGHHISRLGAEYFSADIADSLLPYVGP